MSLEELKKLAEAAGARPWRQFRNLTSSYADDVCVDNGQEWDDAMDIPQDCFVCDTACNETNAAFIAAANPATVLKLLEIIAVLWAGLTQGLIHAPSNWQTHHDLLAANRRANEIERSL